MFILPADSVSQQKRQGASRTRTEQPGAKKQPAGKKNTSGKKRQSSGKGSRKSGRQTNASKNRKGNQTASSNRSEKDVRRDKKRAENDMQETRRQIRLNARETSQKLNQLSLVEGQIEECNGRIGVISTRLDSLNAGIGALNDSILSMDRHLKQITATYIKAIKRSQGRRQQMSALAFIFSSDSFAQAYRRARYLRRFAKWREKRAAEITSARQALEQKRRQLASLADAADKSKKELSHERASLVRKQQETETLVGELRSQGNALKEVMEQQRSRAAALERELDNVIAQEAARREAERKAAEAEKARKAAEAERAEAARKAAEEEAARKEAEAEKARKEAEQARKQAKKEAEKREAERKAAEAEKARKEAAEAKKAAKKAEDEARKAAEKKKKEEKRNKTKPVRHDKKQQPEEKVSTGAGSTAGTTLRTPDSASERGTASKAVETGQDFASLKGRVPFPITGGYTIVRRFGRHKHPSLPHVETDNAGIDIETAKNAPVRSVCDGEVSAVFRPDGYNSVVVIRHGGYMTVYANLASVSVSTGQKVKAGQNIGAVFSDPNDKGRSILHFEIRNGRQKENPEIWLRR